MKRLKHMDYFERLLEEPKNELVQKAIEEGKIPVGYSCFFVPEPILSMDKMFPVKLRAPKADDIEYATYFISSLTCSYARSILQYALDGEYDFLNAIVGTTSCSHIVKCAETCEYEDTHKHDKNFVYAVMDTPKKKNYDKTIEAYVYQFKKKLLNKLAKTYGIDISDEALRKSIKFHNEFNVIMREISDLRKLDNPKITGYEFHVIYTATKVVPKDMLIDKLKETLEELKQREGISDYKARIMVAGSILDNPEYTKLIEEQGAIVVADRYCSGSLPGLEPIPEDGDPYFNLCNHYMLISQCPRNLGTTYEKRDYALKIAKEYKVGGP